MDKFELEGVQVGPIVGAWPKTDYLNFLKERGN
jgi:hypothetical protein